MNLMQSSFIHWDLISILKCQIKLRENQIRDTSCTKMNVHSWTSLIPVISTTFSIGQSRTDGTVISHCHMQEFIQQKMVTQGLLQPMTICQILPTLKEMVKHIFKIINQSWQLIFLFCNFKQDNLNLISQLKSFFLVYFKSENSKNILIDNFQWKI